MHSTAGLLETLLARVYVEFVCGAATAAAAVDSYASSAADADDTCDAAAAAAAAAASATHSLALSLFVFVCLNGTCLASNKAVVVIRCAAFPCGV
jgi:hypothetical protein